MGDKEDKELTGDADYTLTGQSMWVTVKDMSVHISKTDDGVLVDIWALGQEGDDRGLLTSTYAFDDEARVAISECLESVHKS